MKIWHAALAGYLLALAPAARGPAAATGSPRGPRDGVAPGSPGATSPARVSRPARRIAILSGPTMGTSYRVRLARPLAEARAHRLQLRLEAQLEALENTLSTYRPDSELSRFNQRKQLEPASVSPQLTRVLELALSVGERTGGAFDVTVAPLVNALGFGWTAPNTEPTPGELEALRQNVGQQHLELNVPQRQLSKRRAGVTVDLSGIAKGHAVDLLSTLLVARGQAHHLVEIGGEVRVAGRRGDGSPWRIAVEMPRTDRRRSPHLVLPLQHRAAATSGTYRQFRRSEGRVVTHVLDPRSGQPVRHGLASVTVLAATAAEADALATALLVMGPEQAPAFAERNGLPALFIERRHERWITHASSAFPDRASLPLAPPSQPREHLAMPPSASFHSKRRP